MAIVQKNFSLHRLRHQYVFKNVMPSLEKKHCIPLLSPLDFSQISRL